MTVGTTSRVADYVGNGITTAFAVPFQFFELAVYADADLVDPSEYVITQSAPGLAGTVTFNTVPPTDTAIVLSGDTEPTQQTDYVENDSFPADAHERGMDRLAMAIQELKRDTGFDIRWLDYPGRIVSVNDTGNFEPLLPVAAGYSYVNTNGEVEFHPVGDLDTPQTIAATTQALAGLTLKVGDPVLSMSATPRVGFLRLGEADTTYNKADYPELAAWLATQSYPWGSTAFTFDLPPAAGYFLRFAGSTTGVDPAGPRLAGSTQTDLVKAHTHAVSTTGTTSSDGAHTHTLNVTQGLSGSGSGSGSLITSAANTTSSSGVHTHTTSATGTAAANTGAENRPKNVAFHVDILASSALAMSSLGTFGFCYAWDTGTTAADPGTAKVRGNHATLASITALYLSNNDAWSVDLSNVLGDVSVGQVLRLSKIGAQNSTLVVRVSGAPTVGASYTTVPVTVRLASGTFAAASVLAFEISGQSGDITPALTALASAVSTDASAAAASATAAAASATAASGSATAAASSATSATASASTATTQATSATASASTATTQASTATTQATASAASATTASTQATAASGSATAAAASAVTAAAQAAALTGTSTTSLAIGTGSKAFTTQASKQWGVGTRLFAFSDADPTNYMFGNVTAYSTTSLTLNVTHVGGSGTFADWTIRIGGDRGAVGPAGSLDFSLLSSVTPASGDKVALGDVSDSDNVKYGTVATVTVAGVASILGVSAALQKGNGSGALVPATAGTDYVAATSGSAIQKANGSGGLTAATSGTDYAPPSSGATVLKGNGSGGFTASTDGTDHLSSATGVKQGLHTIWIPAGAMKSRTTNGAAAGASEMTTNKNMFVTLDFDTTTQEFAQFEVHMPKSWDLGTVTFQPVWSHAATTTNFGVVWALEAIARSDDDAGDVAFGTAVTSTDTGGTTNDLYIGPVSAAITVGGTPAAGDTVQFQVKRVPADGSDTMAIDVRLHGVRVFFTTNAATDA